jgi:hypothetical protein
LAGRIRIAAPGPHLTLCLNVAEYKQALKHLKVAPVDEWIKNSHANATVYTIASPAGLACIVCLNGYENHNPIEVAGLLVHESVHIWQEYCDYYGETQPGSEQEAYAVQALAQELMAEFARRLA